MSAVSPAPAAPLHNPAKFVPVLYLMQSMPIFLVQEVSATIFKSLGIANSDVATWSALLALPWSFKLLWGPVIDINGTKRKWITWLQVAIVLGLILSGLALNAPQFFGVTLAVLATVAILSATVDIATDGFYLLASTRQQQQAFVGWQSLFFRLGRLIATFGVPFVAGALIDRGTPEQQAWMFGIFALAVLYGVGALANRKLLPFPEKDLAHQPAVGENKANLGRLVIILGAAGFGWVALGSVFAFLGYGLHLLFPEALKFWTFPETPEKFILLFVTLYEGPAVVVHGLRLGVGGLLAVLLGWLAGKFVGKTEMGSAFSTFFRGEKLFGILAFMLFYRFSEAMLGRITPIFLQDVKENPADPTGGLGYTVTQVAFVNGAAGPIGLVLGGVVGGLVVSRLGIRKSFLLLVAAMQIPNLLYVWAASAKPVPEVMAGVLAFDQFGYGFGFAGYLIALQYIAQRNPRYVTAHYAIGTGLGALFIAASGTLGGALMNVMDFQQIFIFVLFLSIPSLLTIFFVPVDPDQKVEVRDVDVD
ncbi:MAG: hypothetical protein MUC92_08315 [Fimbriimonadaceae bacterium]|jgi:PAT family beta-lactamase induction signal transducer AmpG|nr:hypothetical protein [Fimbriimonadaceae bacterium]